MAEFHAIADQLDSFPAEYRIVRPDGRVLWVSGRGRVVARGPDGKAQRLANIVMDVTDRKLAEERIVLLMREISHRSKNLLAVVQSIASQTVRTSQQLSDFEDKFSHRLLSLAGSQDLLVKENWKGVTLADLVHRQLEMFIVPGRQLVIDGPELYLEASAAQAIGLALHELATNALKHGAWSSAKGMVTVSWSLREETNRLAWTESGGPPVEEPASSGFGTFLITNAVADTVGGEAVLAFLPSGLSWTLIFPTAERRH